MDRDVVQLAVVPITTQGVGRKVLGCLWWCASFGSGRGAWFGRRVVILVADVEVLRVVKLLELRCEQTV